MAPAEPGRGLLDRLAPVLDSAGSPEQRRALLAGALAEHRRQGAGLFAPGASGAQRAAAGIAQGLARLSLHGLADAARQTLQPLAHRHPYALLAVGGAAGVLLALARPQRMVRWGWRWLRPVLGLELSQAVHGLLRQGLRRTLAGLATVADALAPVSAVRHGVAPSADRADGARDPS